MAQKISNFFIPYLRQAEVGRYLEYIFPILQIRFVSVNNNYDSSNRLGVTGGMSVALKNLAYMSKKCYLDKYQFFLFLT